MTKDHDDPNPYLALRQAKIARNEARMRELGLLKAKRAIEAPRPIQPPPRERAQPVRRSSRLRSSPQSVEDVALETELVEKRPPKRQRPTVHQTTATPSQQSFPAHSARAMSLDVNQLIQHVLGRPMRSTGKAHVMEESARLAVEGHVDGTSISFNKFSGAQMWGNNALFLWINLNAPQSEVINEFPDGGRQVTWFGGSRMHDGTAVIQKLLQVGSDAKAAEKGEGVVLWCREYIQEIKTFSPYVCLGRLSVSF